MRWVAIHTIESPSRTRVWDEALASASAVMPVVLTTHSSPRRAQGPEAFPPSLSKVHQ
jgi:hypothetical protein